MGRAIGGRAAVVALALALSAPASALALPGDPPITTLTPADGATVPANPAGIGVTYRCPAYVQEIYGDPAAPIVSRGGADDYRVSFSRSPALGSNGLLASSLATDSGRVGADGATCASALDTFDSSASPETVGGRVYWQASRSCIGCAGQRPETSPVRSFVVKPARVKAKFSVQRRVYAGYLSVFKVSASTDVAREVALQRRVGKRWKTFVKGSSAKSTELVAKLPAGKQTLRAVLVIGTQSQVVATKKVTVRRGGRRTTSARDDGSYKPRKPKGKETTRFKVGGGGRVLRDFNASVVTFCFGPTFDDNHVQVNFAGLRSAKIAPDGTVVGLLQLKSGARVVLNGKLRHGRLRGRVSIALSTCNGARTIDAVRKG